MLLKQRAILILKMWKILSQINGVFTCPEEGCILTFMGYGQLCLHLDKGNHLFQPNSLNIRERTQKRYASLVESKISPQKTLEC